MPEHAGFLPCRPGECAELFACSWSTLAIGTTRTDESQGGSGTPAGISPSGARDSRGPSVGRNETSGGDALGSVAPHLSGPLGDALAHAPSLPYHGLDAPDLRPGRQPTHGSGGGDRRVGSACTVAGPSQGSN